MLPLAKQYFTVVERLEGEIQDFDQDGLSEAELDRRKMDILVDMREHLAFRTMAVSKCVDNPSLTFTNVLKSASKKSFIDWLFKLINKIWNRSFDVSQGLGLFGELVLSLEVCFDW